MNDNSMTDLSGRSPDLIAAEIIAIKEQTKKILLVSAVEIGRRLLEAKAIMPYGQFVDWLETAVAYSESTAYNLMRLAEEYSSEKTAQLAKLGYTQALILLGLPAEERADFITRFDLENTAVRELQQAVNEKKQALAEKEVLQKENAAQKEVVTQLTAVNDQATKEISEKQQALWSEQEKVTVLQRKLDLLENENAAAQRFAELEHESTIMKINLSMAQADARFDLIAKGFEDLFAAMNEMAASDPNAFRLYLTQVNSLLKKTSAKVRRLEKNQFT